MSGPGKPGPYEKLLLTDFTCNSHSVIYTIHFSLIQNFYALLLMRYPRIPFRDTLRINRMITPKRII